MIRVDPNPIEHGTLFDVTKPANPPAADPAHPAHHSWIAGVANGLIEAGKFVITGGKVVVDGQKVNDV